MAGREIVHDFSEFPDAENLDLESWGLPKWWGISVMGTSCEDQGVKAHTHVFKTHEEIGDEFITHVYPIPRAIKLFLASEYRRGRADKLAEIKSTLET